MFVYVLHEREKWEGEFFLGVFSTVNKAKRERPGAWDNNHDGTWTNSVDHWTSYVIVRVKVDG